MRHDFSKPSHIISTEEMIQKRRLPVYMLILSGLFLVSIVVYMLAHWV